MKRTSGFTLIELLVVIAIIALLVSILMPSLQKAKDMAKDVVCSSNQRSVSTAIHMYAQDYDDILPYNTFIQGGFWSLSWAKRVGRLMDRPEGLPTSGFFQPPRSAGGKIYAEYKVSVNGYVDFNWHLPTGGLFKCPTFWDQFEPKAPGAGHPLHPVPNYWDTMGLQFSINGVISPGTRMSPQQEKDGKYTFFTKLSDISGKVVLISDCSVGGVQPDFIMPRRALFGSGLRGKKNWDSRSLSERTLRLNYGGPWTMITDMVIGSGDRTTPFRKGFYGHSGNKTNLAFTDAHVEAIGDSKVKLRLFEW